ncbi:Prefoldin, subunit 4 [Tuber magnatum]|uniref:Prefoldin subunit 4 n=1 Tax=Tuber magnatum TaxID=42249 RepID=A0A317T2C2_9PEZI|nr:Prefoldin, subunit 4 [Tuber magnatum]
MNRRMLSPEDESTTEVTVTREDQDRINKFSTLHQKQELLKDELEKKSQEKEYIEDVSNELELADEDDLIPYKIGDSFFHLPLEEATQLLNASKEEVGKEVAEIVEKMEANESVMNGLKVELYAKFGKAINLEV